MADANNITPRALNWRFSEYLDTMFEVEPTSGMVVFSNGVPLPHNRGVRPAASMPWKHDLYAKDLVWGLVHGTFPFGVVRTGDQASNGIANLTQVEGEGYSPSETAWWTYNYHYYPIMVELVNMDRTAAIVRPVTDNWLSPKDPKHLAVRLHTLRQLQVADIHPSLTVAYRVPACRVQGSPRWCTFADRYEVRAYNPQRRGHKTKSTYANERIGELCEQQP